VSGAKLCVGVLMVSWRRKTRGQLKADSAFCYGKSLLKIVVVNAPSSEKVVGDLEARRSCGACVVGGLG